MTMKEASKWASSYLKKNVTVSNISYLIQYGRIKKHEKNGTIVVDKKDMIKYYNSFLGKREINWKEQLGEDLNWELSFEQYKESETTKHVHRLHPYKGKFIPQLVEYFLDDHTDRLKKEVFFRPGDIILDPFCGSGTTLVQANELGMHAIGLDISAFNSLISNVKIGRYNFEQLQKEMNHVIKQLKKFSMDSNIVEFENELLEELSNFNKAYFPVPDYKYKVRNKEIDVKTYSKEKEKLFLPIFSRLVEKYNVKLHQKKNESFLDKWFIQHVRNEIEFAFELIKNIEDKNIKKVLAIVLSRTMRSCRATTHSDLATLKEPVMQTYYCTKHGKICKPLFSIIGWFERYCKDTIKRLKEFHHLRTDTEQICITGDSRNINILEALKAKNTRLYELTKKNKIKGIFSSPPYVGLIDYHEQHAYAYELFGFKRNDHLEIGPLFKGSGKEARSSYVQGISDVLNHCKQFLADDFDIFLVANDKYNLYPEIAKRANLKIVNQYKRPVLNRTERDKNAYAEIIFHLKER